MKAEADPPVPPRYVPEAEVPGDASRWGVLGVVTLAHVMSSYSVLSVQTLAPFIKADLRLDHLQVGLMTSMFYAGTFFLSVPAGSLVDRIGEYKVLLGGQLIIGLFIAGFCAVRSFAGTVPFLILAGVGYAGINPATGKAIVDRFPPRGRALAMSVKQNGVPVGGALVAATLPGIALAVGWRSATAIAGLVSLLSVLAIRLAYARYARQCLPGNDGVTLACSRWARVGEILRNRNLMFLSAAVLFFQGFQLSLITYFILYAKEVLSYSILAAGALFSLANLSGTIGRLCWGAASDYLLDGARRAMLIASGLLSSAMCLVFACLSPRQPAWLVWAATFFLGFSAMGWPGIFLTLVGELSGAEKAGSAFGLCVAVVSLGVFIGPPLFGYLVDRTGSYSAAWIAFCVLLAGAAALIGFVREPQREDSLGRAPAGRVHQEVSE